MGRDFQQMHSMNIIEVHNLGHRFPDGAMGLEGINLEIEEGSFVVLAGANGSGKTTFLRHLNGLLQPSTGGVRLDGVAVEKNPIRARQRVGMVFQDADAQIVGETVYEDVAFGPENLCLARGEIRRRVEQALKTVGLAGMDERQTHLLSGGEKRRLAIAGVLAMNPRVIVCDEPFASLDYPGVRQVLEQILMLHRSGRTILLATHDIEKVVAHAERLLIIHAGRIVHDGRPQEVVHRLETFGVRKPCAYRYGLEPESWLT
jgi:biotin transport system ATP-binding protein